MWLVTGKAEWFFISERFPKVAVALITNEALSRITSHHKGVTMFQVFPEAGGMNDL